MIHKYRWKEEMEEEWKASDEGEGGRVEQEVTSARCYQPWAGQGLGAGRQGWNRSKDEADAFKTNPSILSWNLRLSLPGFRNSPATSYSHE